MSPCHLLVPIAFIAGARNVVLDAGWPLLDSTRLRNDRARFWVKILKISISSAIDFLSFNLANLVFLESKEQIIRLRKCGIRSKKFQVSYTGFNELQMRRNLENKMSKTLEVPKEFILFRGSINNESGLDFLLELASNLRPGLHLVLATSGEQELKEIQIKLPSQLVLITGYRSEAELEELYKKCQFAIGQFGRVSRTDVTIPHKFFEAAYHGKAYLSPPRKALLELLPRECGFFVDETEPATIAKIIDQEITTKARLRRYEDEIRILYSSRLNQKLISKEFLDKLESRRF